MNQANTLPAPEIPQPATGNAKWQREYDEFLRLRPQLLKSYRGKYVAIHNGRPVQTGTDQIEVALRAYEQYGYVAIYVGLVSDAPPTTARMPSPRLQVRE